MAASFGADAIGLNFYARSPRAIGASEVAGILDGLPAFTTVVGLVVNPEQALVEEVLGTGQIHCLQFHGDESLGFCQSFGVPFIKAIRVNEISQAEKQLDEFATHCTVILDAFVQGDFGGTGKTFDWSIARTLVDKYGDRIVLAGGLDPENVGQAIVRVQPYGVDVSSGVESQPGIKSRHKMQSFFEAVHCASLD
jgi:phosphoribosylanthranilate isomerase